MELACFTENESHFSQSEQILPMTEPAVSELGLLGDTKVIKLILAGNYTPPLHMDHYLKELLEAANVYAKVDSSIYCISWTPKDRHLGGKNKLAWKKCRIASAESSGLTMDHCVAGSADQGLNAIDTLFRQLPYQHGFSPTLWQTLTDVEILKKAGVSDIELMQAIQLMDSSFNMNSKKLGREVMHFAECHHALTSEQYSSRKQEPPIHIGCSQQTAHYGPFRSMLRSGGAVCQ
jgi:hypothetical protein